MDASIQKSFRRYVTQAEVRELRATLEQVYGHTLEEVMAAANKIPPERRSNRVARAYRLAHLVRRLENLIGIEREVEVYDVYAG